MIVKTRHFVRILDPKKTPKLNNYILLNEFGFQGFTFRIPTVFILVVLGAEILSVLRSFLIRFKDLMRRTEKKIGAQIWFSNAFTQSTS